MARRSTGPASATRIQLGDFWLEPRAERGEWVIAWYDAAARSRRRRTTGVKYGGEAVPPTEAQEALAEHFAASSRPAEPAEPATMSVAKLMDIWQVEHVAVKTEDPARYAISVQHLLRFFEAERRAGRVRSSVTVADVNKKLVDRFIAFRKAEGVGGWTINRDLKALRGSLNHAWRNELIKSVPFVHDVDTKDRAKPRDLVYSPERIAALLEAAYAFESRRHVFLYIMIAMSTLGRSEAILELDDSQIRDDCIHFLADDRAQTSKRRSIVPICPTLAPWLEGISGKVITYRTLIAERNRVEGGPTHFEKPCYDIGTSFDKCLVAAGIGREVFDEGGEQVWLPPRRKLGETEPRPLMTGIGTPNTLRHTIITEMHKRGVPEGQIDTAAGHAGEGTGKRNYRHLRPDYLAELVAAIEAYWSELTRFTTVHLRSHGGPTVVSFASARAGQRIKGL
jgi:hypothetical protein